MSKRSPVDTSEDYVRGQVNQRLRQSLEEDIEAAIISSTQQDHAGLVVGEEDAVPYPEFVDALEDPRKPGAYAMMPGDDQDSFSFPNSIQQHSSPEPDSVVAAQAGLLFIPRLSAQLVDEDAEEQRRLELERRGQELELERQRNRELESRIQQIESDAVVAIPVRIEDTDTPDPSASSPNQNAPGCLQKRRPKRVFAGFLLVVVVAAIIGTVLGIVFRKEEDPQKWNQLGQTLIGDGINDNFGFAVALSANGETLAGSGFGDNGNGPLAGYVRVYSYNSSTTSWNQLGQDLNGKAKGDEFGTLIALSQDGTVLAAGAINELDGKGYIQVHAFNNGTEQWTQIGQDVEGRVADAQFGSSIALSADGNVVAAGGPGRPYNDDNHYSGNQTGYVQVFAFNRTASLWTQMGQDLNGTRIGDAFGRSVALSADGTVVAVGADWSDGNGADPGLVQVFAYNNNNNHWKKIGQDLVGEGSHDYSGFAVALSKDGTIVAVGAVWNYGTNGHNSGHVRVFSYDHASNFWTKIGQDIDGESKGDQFGISVALSADGRIVAAGANRNDGKGGEDSGHVRVFSYDNNTSSWIKVGEDLDGEGADDRFGLSVALSSDGTIVAAGGYLNDGNGPDSGHVRVFRQTL